MATPKEKFWTVETTGQTEKVLRLTKQRAKQQQEFEKLKDQEQTTGLVSKEDFQETRKQLEKLAQEKQLAEQNAAAVKAATTRKKRQSGLYKSTRLSWGNHIRRYTTQRDLSMLSFTDDADEEEEEEEAASKKRNLGKDPTINTSFLPDREREEQENQLRVELRKKWVEEQNVLKQETLNIVYSYWDGRGNRRSAKPSKVPHHTGWTIARFITERVQAEFKELRRLSVDNFMFIKEDLIIPLNYTFYDLIVTKARGKSGPLFSFQIQDDVRLQNDASIERNETHAAKVVEKVWYERNKHIFPASNWEPFDPSKDYGEYRIGKRKSWNT